MARFKNHLLAVVGFALAGAIGAAFGTGTAQAVVSTLVSVVNPTTSPIPSLNMTDPGRVAYQSTINLTNCSSSLCTFNFPAVGASHRLVVQHIGGSVSFVMPVPTNLLVYFNEAPGGTFTGFWVPLQASFLVDFFDQQILFYVDSSNSVSVNVQVYGTTFANGLSQFVTLTGYELDCSVAACVPIATQ